jgi:hypothetical protein
MFCSYLGDYLIRTDNGLYHRGRNPLSCISYCQHGYIGPRGATRVTGVWRYFGTSSMSSRIIHSTSHSRIQGYGNSHISYE